MISKQRNYSYFSSCIFFVEKVDIFFNYDYSICNIKKVGEFTILTAKTKDGLIVILSSKMKKEQLREWRKSENFYCPQCNHSVKLKVGDIIVPHFAHKKDASCSASFSEGESKEHLKGKQQLYNFFQRNVDQVKLEPYFKSLAQRPDLLITHKGTLIPIEFQCSSIPISQVESRTSGYKREEMNPIWILHTPAKLKILPKGVSILQLSKFEAHFITDRMLAEKFFLTYNPQFEQFHYFSSLLHIVGNQYIGIHRTLSISKQIYPFARPRFPEVVDLKRFVWVYMSQRKKYLQTRVLLNRKGINDPFLRGCYELGMLPVELPAWIGVPLTTVNPFPVHAVEWQLALVYFMQQRGLQFDTLSKGAIRNFVHQLGDNSEVQVVACLKFKSFCLSIGVKSILQKVKFDEKQYVEAIALTLLAK